AAAVIPALLLAEGEDPSLGRWLNQHVALAPPQPTSSRRTCRGRQMGQDSRRSMQPTSWAGQTERPPTTDNHGTTGDQSADERLSGAPVINDPVERRWMVDHRRHRGVILDNRALLSLSHSPPRDLTEDIAPSAIFADDSPRQFDGPSHSDG
ncbi:hypothetical protein THAOC_19406, partial [Thalassiosira oceanica]